MCRLVASLACVTGNGGVRSRDQKPNGKGSHHQTRGKAKIGRVNNREPLLEASSSSTTETMDETVVQGQCEKGNPCSPVRAPQAPA